MDSQVIWTLIILIAYIAIIVGIGLWSTRYAIKTLEDYAMASRSLGFWVLFSSVFAANISAVTLIGVPGNAYHAGWILWPYFVTAWGWLFPILIFTVSSRAYLLGQRFGYMTHCEMITARWDSKALGYLFSVCLLFYTVPYLMTGIQGGGHTLNVLTKGLIPFWLGCLIVAVIVCFYLFVGGMRGAAWVNTFQAALFLLGVIVIFFAIAYVLGGPAAATQQIAVKYPELLDRSKMSWKVFFSYGFFVSLCMPALPQIFMRLLTGRAPRDLKRTALIYPLAAIIVFFTVAYVGMWGHVAFPGLKGGESDRILPLLLTQYLPIWMMGILGAAIFAALMSTMDSQVLAASTMILRDFFKVSKLTTAEQQQQAVMWARLTVIILTVIAFILAQLNIVGIINIVNFAFAGFSLMFAPLVAAFYWRRCTKYAVAASILASQATLLGLQYGILPKSWTFGFLPGMPALVIGLVVLVVVTYLTPVPQNEGTKKFFELFDTSHAPVISGKDVVHNAGS
ncbi:MAG: sodium:solute symporter family protein [Bacillota bacterium]